MKTHADSIYKDVCDADLVAASLNGGREDFAKIISRYQSLVCSVGYSATGDLSLSEELAQETFVTAWKQLHSRFARRKNRCHLFPGKRHLWADENANR